MDRKIRVGAVSYLNTKPLIFGFEQGMMKDEVELVIDYPSRIAAALLKDEIDIGLVPVAVLPEMSNYYFVSDYGIGANGDVASVCLFSEVPLQEIKTVLLDYQSRTSVALAKILMKEYWKIDPEIKNTSDDFRTQIKDNTAAVLIGDRALEQRKSSKYIYDLGGAWKEFTGMPFVFAAWVSNKPMNDAFKKSFNEANEFGLKHLNEVLKQHTDSIFNLEKYYTEYIKFVLDESMHDALQLFLKKLNSLK